MDRTLDQREGQALPDVQAAWSAGEAHFRQMIEALPAAIYTTDAQGRLTHFNPAAVEFSGRVPELGSDQWCISWKLFHADGTPMPHDKCPMAIALREGRVLEGVEAIAERPDGTRRWFIPYPTPLYDAEGRLVGGINMLLDITDRKQAEKAGALLAAIVDWTDDAVVSKDLTGIITSWNQGAERLFGYTAAEAVGRSITMLIPPERADEEQQILSRIGRGERVDHFDTIRVRKDGSFVAISLTVSPVRDGSGRIIGASKIARDVTQRKAIEAALQDADRRKDEFLATLAHELRNPLAPIRNSVQILQAKGPPHPELDWARGVLDRQVQIMARLLEDLLDVSRISRGRLDLRSERIELAGVLEAALETSRPVIETGGHTLTKTLPSEPLYLLADSVRLAQVFANLLNNAAKYTEEGGKIALVAQRQGSDAVVSVRDNGIGIAAEMLPRVFEIFSQSPRALIRSQGGLGIGLSLVKGLVELHGGNIEAKSAGAGQGSEFIVRLPLSFEVPLRQTTTQPPAETTRPTTAAHLRILIADDNRDSADTLSRLLKIMGNEVTTAYDGEAAVQLAQATNPQLVLLDIGMPKLNGYDACRRIRQLPQGRDMHLVALTGWGQEEDRRRTEEAGFDQHMVKPVDLPLLKSVLATLSSRESAMEHAR